MWLTFFILLLFSTGTFLVRNAVERVLLNRKQGQYLKHLQVSTSKSTSKSQKKTSVKSLNFMSIFVQKIITLLRLDKFVSYFQQRYDLPKDISIGQLLFIQVGLIFICWNMSGFLKISLLPMLLLAALIEGMGAFLMLSKRRLIDQLDKSFPQLLESLASMYHIHPDLKHSFESSRELVSDPVSKRFLTELTKLTQIGLPTIPSLAIMNERWQYPPLTFLTASIKVHQSTGGNLAQLFRQTATSLRRHHQNTKAMNAVMFQNKISGFVVSALVPIVLLLSISLSANYRSVIFGEPLARSLVIAAIVWWVIGSVVMWRALRVRV